MDLNITISLPLMLWAFVVNAVGYWAGRTKVKEWYVPIPVLLGVLSICLVSIWGVVAGVVADYASVMGWVCLYVLPNAAVILAAAVYGYDIVHAFGKVAHKWKALWDGFIAIFKKEANA